MAELAYTFHDPPWQIPLHLTTGFTRAFGEYGEGGAFTPFDWTGSTFEMVIGQSRGLSGEPVLVLDTANGDLTPGADGELAFLFRPDRLAGLEAEKVYTVDINRVQGGVTMPFMRGRIATYAGPVAA